MIEFSPFWRVQKIGWFGIFGWPCCNGVAGASGANCETQAA